MKFDEVPTVAINKFQIIAGGSLVRFAFGEQVALGGDISFHSAITMTKEDAQELANCINKLIAETQKAVIVPQNPTIN